jgi:hypothetical protein
MITKSQLIKAHGKKALLEIADYLEIQVQEGTHAYAVIDLITQDIEDNGIPEPDEEMSDSFIEFMCDLGYYGEDSDGYLVVLNPTDEDVPDVPEPTSPKRAAEEEVDEKFKISQCWGKCRPDDPSCKKCAALHACYIKRMDDRAKRPCFGKLFDAEDADCHICIEGPDCEKLMKETSK